MSRSALYDRFGVIIWASSVEEGIDIDSVVGTRVWDHAANSDEVKQAFMLALLDFNRHEVDFIVAATGLRSYSVFQQMRAFPHGAVAGTWMPANGSIQLTRREQEVIHLVARDLTNKEIARTLGITISTVDAHRRAVRQKIGKRGTAGETRWAIEHGLG